MIGKNEETTNDDNATVKTITDKRKILEDNSAEIRKRVTNCFNQLSNSLKIREKQLLRQIEAIHNQQLSIIQSNSELLPSVPSINVNFDNYKILDETIKKFGRIELPDKDGMIVKDAEPYRVEEYVEANKDHVSFDKSIKLNNENDIIINLNKNINLLNNINTTDLSNNSIDNKIELIQKIDEKDNNNCSDLCSPLLETSINLTDESEYNFRVDNTNKNLCSSHSITDSSNELTIIDCKKNNETDENLSEINQINDNLIMINSNKTLELSDNNGKDEHPKQIQQWLEQILVETETEPLIHEIEQFAEISKSRYREFEFSLKT